MRKRHAISLVSLALMLVWCPCVRAKASDTLWTRTYGDTNNDYGRSACQSSDGGYALVGFRETFSPEYSSNVFVVKVDRYGDTLWTRVYEDSTYEHAHAIRHTADGGYVITGRTRDLTPLSADIYLIKTDSQGDTLWRRTYGGGDTDLGYSVEQTADGGYIIAGATYSFGAGLDDGYIIRTDGNGDTLWTRTYGGLEEERLYSVRETADGGFIAAGFTVPPSDSVSDVFLVRMDASGDSLWTKTYRNPDYDYARAIRCTYPDGGYIVVGSIRYDGEPAAEVYVIKTDADGDTLWTRTCGGNGNDYGNSICQVDTDGYIIAGETDSFGAGGSNVYVIRMDANGDTSWTRTYGGSGTDRAYEVERARDGSYIVVGDTGSSGAGGFDFYLLKMSCDAAAVASGQGPISSLTLAACPNPFKGSTQLTFGLSRGTPIRVGIYDVRGRLIARLVDDVLEIGDHAVRWDGKDLKGFDAAPGTYFCRLGTSAETATLKLVLTQ